MKQIKAGFFLISNTTLDDPHFDKVVIYITEYNEKGAMGFVTNKLFPRAFNELAEFNHSKSFPLYEGGPVENESLYFLHRLPSAINEGSFIADGIYMGGNFNQAVQYINNNSNAAPGIKLFIGYCGWDPGQLEEELAEGSWLLCTAAADTVFTGDVAMLWNMLSEQNEQPGSSVL